MSVHLTKLLHSGSLQAWKQIKGRYARVCIDDQHFLSLRLFIYVLKPSSSLRISENFDVVRLYGNMQWESHIVDNAKKQTKQNKTLVHMRWVPACYNYSSFQYIKLTFFLRTYH